VVPRVVLWLGDEAVSSIVEHRSRLREEPVARPLGREEFGLQPGPPAFEAPGPDAARRRAARASPREFTPEGDTVVVTFYEPDPAEWEDGFMRRKPRP
jgi:hypothetical protein